MNLDGEVVGLAALISAGPGGSYGYAVPINRVRRTAQALIKYGRAPHPYIGVSLRDVRELDPAERRKWGGGELPPRGALVSRIWRDAPAARAGLRLGDVITSINNRDVPTPAELADAHLFAGGRRQAGRRLRSLRDAARAAAVGGGAAVGHDVGGQLAAADARS